MKKENYKFSATEWNLFINNIEIWRKTFCSNSYAISTFGKLKRLEGWKKHGRGKGRTITKIWVRERLLSPTPDGKGYLQARIHKKMVKIHKLVAKAFLKNPNNYKQINHKIPNKRNNQLVNLEYCTSLQNTKHAWDNGLMEKSRLLTKKRGNEHMIKHIRKKVKCLETGKIFNSTAEAARWLGVHRSNITNACKGKTKTSGGYHWQYV